MRGGFKMKCMRTEKISRRDLLRGATAAAVAGPWFFARARALAGVVEKPFRGIFAILQTPFNAYDQIDEQDVEREVHFCIRLGAQGLVWPQLFSEFYLLSEDERMRVASLILRAAAGRAAVVIGVQAPSKELAIKFARHAEEHRADAVIALPPYLGSVPAETVASYYRSLAAAIRLPVFIQNTGGSWGPALSTSTVIQLAKENPRLGYIKEEIAPVPHRIEEYSRSKVMKGIFSGNAGRNFLNELARGSSGTMPACEFIDIHVQIYNLASAGKTQEAYALFERLLPMINLEETYGLSFAKRVLVRRGIFKTAKLRGIDASGLDRADEAELDTWWKELATYLKD